MNILQAMEDPNLFQPWFNKPTWGPWKVALSAIFGLPMNDGQKKIFQECTGRTDTPTNPAREAWAIVGRRGGKSFVAAAVAVYLATFREYRRYLSPGERATVMLLAADRKQARTAMRYINGLLEHTPMVKSTVSRANTEEIELDNGVQIEIGTASIRTTRGYTLAAVIADEIAFWRSDENSSNPDTEILNALRPGLATIPGSLLLCISSPYSRRGAMWETYRRHWGKDGDPVLVWKAPTRTMNSSVPQSIIDSAMEADESAAAAEYGADFRRDIEGFIQRESAESCVIPHRLQLPPVRNIHYQGFVDPSGGSADSMTLGISHGEDGRVVLDNVLERKPPFSPEQVTAEFSAVLKQYGIRTIHGDRYAGQWPREQFSKHGIAYHVSEKSKSDIYQALLPLINSGKVELLDYPRLISQLCALERRTARGGRDSIDHAPGAHDDLINAAAGALTLANKGISGRIVPLKGF